MLSTCHLPKNVDFSNCVEAELQSCDLAEQTQLRFRDGAKVSLTDVKNLKNGTDFSNCAELKMVNCDMQELRWLGFRQGAKIYLKDIANFPAGVDFSPCADVFVEKCDFKKLSAICFGKGAKVNLNFVTRMPAFVDMSECEKIDIYDVLQKGFDDTKTLVLRNKAQLKEFEAKRNATLQQLKHRSDELRKAALTKHQKQTSDNENSDKISGSFFSRLFGRGGR